MRLVLLLLVLTSCGRLSFDGPGDDRDADVVGDARGDGTGGQPFACVALNDEDGDTIPDCQDPCPHVAFVQSDDDGDGIGNDCDPNLSTPGDVFVMFDPFVTLQPIWNAGGGATVENGQLVLRGEQGGRFSYVDQPMLRGHDVFGVRAMIESGSGGFPQHVSIAQLGTKSELYCEVLDESGVGVAQLAWTFDAVNYTSAPGSQFDGTSIIGGAGELQMKITDVVKCFAGWRTAESFTASSDPLAIPTDRLQLSAQNVTARLDWFLHIHSP